MHRFLRVHSASIIIPLLCASLCAAHAAPVPPPEQQVQCNKLAEGVPPPSVSPNGEISPNPVPQTDAQLRCQGELRYRQRPAAVQRVMRRMYGNDGTYRRLSALFVDSAPGDPPNGAVRVVIGQPNSVRAALYAGAGANGQPREIRVAQGDHLTVYNPAANVFTQIARQRGGPHLDVLSDVPLGVQQQDLGGTAFSQGNAAPALVLADALIHPAAVVTSPLFESSRVRLARTERVDGRTAWVLAGTRIKTVHATVHHGNAWRAWVDTRTGIVLRLVYLRNGREIGSAGMQAIQIDGAGTDPNAGSILERWSLPTSAAYQDPIAYPQVTASHDSPLGAWYRGHADVVIGLAIVLILLVLRVAVGRALRHAQGQSTKERPAERAEYSG